MGPELKGVSEQNGTKGQVPAQPYTPDGLLGDPLMGTCLDATDTSWGREQAPRTKSGCAQQRLMIAEAVERARACPPLSSSSSPISFYFFFSKIIYSCFSLYVYECFVYIYTHMYNKCVQCLQRPEGVGSSGTKITLDGF